MLTPEAKKALEKQSYIIVGEHSAVKTCGWTKNMLRGEGGCYKFKFYGIRSHQCMQMTTSISCANRCSFCWRDYKAPVSKEWKWAIDDPDFIIENSIAAHHKLLTGFGGNEKVSKYMYGQSGHVGHVALSLTGEPITYPKMNELVQKFHKKRISTFIVTNAQYPDAIKSLATPTQLYLSVDAPDKATLKKVDVPLFADYWERLLLSLDYCRDKKYRTTIRLTCVKGEYMHNVEGYARLVKRGNPDFIEVKGYMHVGASQQRLKRENMPSHGEVREFGMQLLEKLPDYEFASEHTPSRVVLLAKKKWHRKTWIDYDRFFELVNAEGDYPENLNAEDYTVGTRDVKTGTKDEMSLD